MIKDERIMGMISRDCLWRQEWVILWLNFFSAWCWNWFVRIIVKCWRWMVYTVRSDFMLIVVLWWCILRRLWVISWSWRTFI